MATKPVYRVIFYNHGKIYELYARKVQQAEIYAFVAVEDIIFGERSSLLVDPSEEKLKSEFEGVRRTFVPMQSVVRIDQVEKEGQNKIHEAGEGSNVMHFPLPPPTGKDSK